MEFERPPGYSPAPNLLARLCTCVWPLVPRVSYKILPTPYVHTGTENHAWKSETRASEL